MIYVYYRTGDVVVTVYACEAMDFVFKFMANQITYVLPTSSVGDVDQSVTSSAVTCTRRFFKLRRAELNTMVRLINSYVTTKKKINSTFIYLFHLTEIPQNIFQLPVKSH